MISWKRTNQGGALRTFLIVAVALAIVTILAINFVQNRGEQARRDQAIAQAEDKEAADKPVTVPGEEAGKDEAQTETSETAGGDETTRVPVAGTNTLPTTGPGDLLVSLVTIGLLTGSLVSYFTSRRMLNRSL